MKTKPTPDTKLIRAALALAKVLCEPYPTPEGWERERRQNARVVFAAYEAVGRIEMLLANLREGTKP